MNGADHIQDAIRLLSKGGFSDAVPAHQITESVARARIALAIAVGDLAEAAADNKPIPAGPTPAGVTARIITAYGRRFSDLRATVDVVVAPYTPKTAKAVCRCCGRVSLEDSRREVALDWAEEHAKECMALPCPNGEETTR